MNAPRWPDPSIDALFLTLNIVWCIRAVGLNAAEAKEGFRQWRRTRKAITAFACFYCLSYATLLFGVWDRLDWSHFMIGVSPWAWELVWARPAAVSRKVRAHMVHSGVAVINARSDVAGGAERKAV